MKIGCGVTTYNRPKHLELFKLQLERHWAFKDNGIEMYAVPFIADDGEWYRRGIAVRKNECLRALKDCDYVFLFDDDCFPIKEGWAEFFIEASKASGQQHFMYLKETPTIKRLGTHIGQIEENHVVDSMKVKITCPVIEIIEYNNCSGCMMLFTKEVIEKVGAYNPAYGYYGFEHAGYSNRVHKAGLTPLGVYTCPVRAGEYIYSMDLDNHLPFNKQLNHKSSIGIREGLESIQKNKEIYLQDTEIYIPL